MEPVTAMFMKERPLRRVVDTAGVVDNNNRVLLTMMPQRCPITFVLKVDSTWHLHQLTQGMDLDLFVMFSSISGVLAMVGLGNYAAANTFLDVLAYLQ